MADITVYGTRLSPFVEKVVRGIQIKKLSYELIEPKTPLDLRRWNPQTRKMPLAEIRGERVPDSTLILRRLDEAWPEPPLVAEDPVAAAAQRQLEDWSDESLYWYTMALRWNPRHVDATLEQILSAVPGVARPLVKPLARLQFGGIPWQQGLGRWPEELLLDEYGRRLDDLDVMRGGREFYFADRPSVADLAVYGQLRTARNEVTPELEALIAQRPGLVDYMKRVEQATGG
jgi:glutathione S-transferase